MLFYLIEWSKTNFEIFFTFSMIFFISSMIFFSFKKIKNHHFRAFFSLSRFWIFFLDFLDFLMTNFIIPGENKKNTKKSKN